MEVGFLGVVGARFRDAVGLGGGRLVVVVVVVFVGYTTGRSWI